MKRNVRKVGFILIKTALSVMLLTGCGKAETVTTEVTVAAGPEDFTEDITESSLITNDTLFINVDKFMNFYNLTEKDVPREYVQDYIWSNRISADEVLDGKVDFGNKVQSDYILNNDCFKYVSTNFYGAESSLPISVYMDNATMIKIEFAYADGELEATQTAIIDLKNQMIYYDRFGIDTLEDADLSAPLSEEQVAAIREELPQHITEFAADGEWKDSMDYSVFFEMRDDKYERKFIAAYGCESPKIPGFEEYWKNLYKTSFLENWRLRDEVE